jgi:hypothetical protein
MVRSTLFDTASTVRPSSPTPPSLDTDPTVRPASPIPPPTQPATPPILDMNTLCSMCGYCGHTRAHCAKNERAWTRCETCHKVGHYTKECHKTFFCGFCYTWGHKGYQCTIPHVRCSPDRRCPVPPDHPYPTCPRPYEDTLSAYWGTYDGDYDAYDDIDWEAQDHSP